MGSLFQDLFLVHHSDAVSVSNGRKTVGNDDGGASLTQAVKGSLDLGLGDTVQGAAAAEDPSIIWDNHDITKREQIVAGLDVDLLVSATKGIKEFTVEIKSASLTPDELAGTGLCNVLNICYPKQSYDSRNPEIFIDVEEPLRGLGFAVGSDVVNKTFVKLSITQFMGVLQAV